MQSTNKQIPWSIVFMIGSLCLLGAFEFFWLRSEYLDEQDQLHEQQTQRLHEAIRELEDSLIQVKVWTPFDISADSLECKFPRKHMAAGQWEMKPDSGKTITVMRSFETRSPDSLRIRRRHHPERGTMILGTLSKQLLEERDSTHIIISLPEILSEKLASMDHDRSDLHYKLVSWEDNAPPDSLGLLSRSYFDMMSGAHYALVYPRFKGYLLQMILPQIAFALILFACISGAFWVISRNMRRQRALAEMRSNLISNITHELKTPISTVHVALEALQNFNADNDKSRRQEYLTIAQSEISRLSLLVDKVLKTSNPGQGKPQLKIETFDLHALTLQILDTLKFQLNSMSALVHMDVNGNDFMIEGDKLHLTGLVHNLVDNALKYGGDKPEIDVTLLQQNGNISLSVTDHGIGIPKEYQDKIFDKFFRVPSGDVHNIKGHGLGLSYVAEVVREHGGEINVQSELDRGTTFLVTLPKMHAN